MSKSIKVSEDVLELLKNAQGVRETYSDVVEKCILVVTVLGRVWGVHVKELTVDHARKFQANADQQAQR